MIEDSFQNSIEHSITEDPTFYYDGGNQQKRNKTFDQQQQQQSQYHQEEQRNSNRDSGISSEKQKQQQNQQQPKISEHMSRFLSDTMKLHESFENQNINAQKDVLDYSMYADGKVLMKKSQAFVALADNWEQKKERQHYKQTQQQRSPLISSLPPTSNMQEGARGEINPTRFSDRLTPEVEIIHDYEKRESRRSKYDTAARNGAYEARPKSSNIRARRPTEQPRRQSEIRKNNLHQLDIRPLSRPRSQSRQNEYRSNSKASCNNSCNSSARCCHHTTVYQYNYPPDHLHHKYDFESHTDKYQIRNQPRIQNADERILKNLAYLQAECTRSKRIAKASHRNFDYDDDVFLPNFSPPHYAKKSYKKTVEFGSIDSGIEEPSFKKVEIPSVVSAHTIMTMLNFNKKYDFLATLARNLLIQRRNVKNLVAEFEAALLRHSDLLNRQISRLESQLPRPNSAKYSAAKKQIEEAKKNMNICNEKAKEFEAIILRDKVTFQKLPEGNENGRNMPDFDYQRKLIYEVFMD